MCHLKKYFLQGRFALKREMQKNLLWKKTFHHIHRVQFYETDLMGVVHHSNYLRFFEEARVTWARHHGLIDYQTPQSAARFAVIETSVRHKRPSFFGDELLVFVQARASGVLRVEFYYEIFKELGGIETPELVATGHSVHVPLDEKLQPIKRPSSMTEVLEKSVWIEI